MLNVKMREETFTGLILSPSSQIYQINDGRLSHSWSVRLVRFLDKIYGHDGVCSAMKTKPENIQTETLTEEQILTQDLNLFVYK